MAYDGRPDGLDIAVLQVDGLTVAGTTGFARIDRTSTEVLRDCWATGFPQFVHQDRQHRPPLRDTEQTIGTIAPGSGLVSGHLRLVVSSRPASMPDESPWAGMSGAVVFTRDRHWNAVALGVVVEHGLPEGSSSLTVLPFTALDALESATRTRVWNLLGTAGMDLPVLPRAEDANNLATPSGAWHLLEMLSSRRAFSHHDRRLVHSVAIHGLPAGRVTEALYHLNPTRAVTVARSLGQATAELRAALREFSGPAPRPVLRAVRALERLCKDHAEDFDPGYGRGPEFFVNLPHIGCGEELHDLSLGPTPLGMPADDSFVAFRVLAQFLAQSCEHLIKVRQAALTLLATLAETYPMIRTEGGSGEVAESIRSGIAELRKLAPALQRAADLVGDVVEQHSGLGSRRDELTALARGQDEITANLLQGIAAVPSMQTWIVPTRDR
ncbi:hypothetical protein [Yinghuangia aomiensis]|uniref:hypothetical protein n=1 Tax=Yinghuangia aomiensis TaxID=676205 RepID=UPI0031E9B537